MAMARPPSVMVLIDRPIIWKTTSVVSTESGIATREMKVVCQLSRNTNNTMATQISASTSTRTRLSIEFSMKLGLAELHVGRAHALRHHALQLRQHGLDLAGDGDGIGVGLLLHGEDDAGLAVEAGIAALGAGGKSTSATWLQRDAMTVAIGDHEIAQILDSGRAADVADQNLARLEVDEAAAGVGSELLQGALDRLEAHVEAGHAARVGDDAVLAHLAADGNDLRNAGNGQQLRAHGEVGQLAQRHRVDAGAGHGDEHDLAHHRRDRTHLRADIRRKLLAHQLQTLGDLLARAVDVDRPIELDVDDR